MVQILKSTITIKYTKENGQFGDIEVPVVNDIIHQEIKIGSVLEQIFFGAIIRDLDNIYSFESGRFLGTYSVVPR